MKGELVIFDQLDYPEEMCSMAISRYDFGLSLYVDDKHKLETQLANTEMISNVLNAQIEFIESEYDSIDYLEMYKDLEMYKSLNANIDNLLDNIECITLSLTNIDNLEFIEKNPIIKTKKIAINETIKITDYDKIKELLRKYDKYKDNIYVAMQNNMKYVSLVDCFNTINKIKEQAEKILALNLSPMETIMYTYDQVRNRVYKKEKEGELYTKSRDLSSVLKNEEIVCVGYANIFTALLRYMNIKCYNARIFHKDNNPTGHERNIIYVKDEKYDIDGMYYFDATWDSKKSIENDEYLDKYLYFAKTAKQMIELEHDSYIYEQMPCYNEKLMDNLNECLKDKMFILSNVDYIKTINYMSNMVDNKSLIFIGEIIQGLDDKNIEMIKERLRNIIEKFDKPIPAETFIKLLNNVRKIEYYENPELYPYTVNSLYKAFIKSNWQFKEHHYDNQERLFGMLFGEQRDKTPKEDFITYVAEEELSRDTEQVQLTKVLQKIANKK